MIFHSDISISLGFGVNIGYIPKQYQEYNSEIVNYTYNAEQKAYLKTQERYFTSFKYFLRVGHNKYMIFLNKDALVNNDLNNIIKLTYKESQAVCETLFNQKIKDPNAILRRRFYRHRPKEDAIYKHYEGYTIMNEYDKETNTTGSQEEFTPPFINKKLIYSTVASSPLAINSDEVVCQYYYNPAEKKDNESQLVYYDRGEHDIPTESKRYNKEHYSNNIVVSNLPVESFYNLMNFIFLCKNWAELNIHCRNEINANEHHDMYIKEINDLLENISIVDISKNSDFVNHNMANIRHNGQFFDDYFYNSRKVPHIFKFTGVGTFMISIDNNGNFDKKFGSIHVPVQYYGFRFLINAYFFPHKAYMDEQWLTINKTKSTEFIFVGHLESFGIGFALNFVELFTMIIMKNKRISDYFYTLSPVIYYEYKFKNKNMPPLHILFNYDFISGCFSIYIIMAINIKHVKKYNQGRTNTILIKGSAEYSPITQDVTIQN